ncbi:hypothetical protein DEI92_07340 [Curtobacterium sp. MCBD17_034]|uniref:hypothetical protein n=1 Tax=unclassified Curtobacterium TaxID=257496 RepID=UPI000DA89504|nr:MULTISPECIES: hypothetical protein [unclassified Curtobacterium]PZF60179.1 hypothetical protein DEI92_07340 [Curtobacterium sp. MCBD17_034]PZM34864.1 hypothetical protein DEI90_05325 [Curtobacterium sp. MCBD17_031]WIE54403.1 hypothetical protein DEI88_014995 [Curtobacterium sp. MCBD17_003]
MARSGTRFGAVITRMFGGRVPGPPLPVPPRPAGLDGPRRTPEHHGSAPSTTHRVRLVVVSSERRLIEAESADARGALLSALGQVPLGFSVASVEVIEAPDGVDAT